MGGVLILVLAKDGSELDRAQLVEEPWHSLMPGTIGGMITKLTSNHSEKWFTIEIKVL